MIGYVSNVEAGSGVPRAVPLRREPLVGIPGCVGVTVKIDHDVIGVVHLDRCHGSRQHSSGCIHDDDAQQRQDCDAGLVQEGRLVRSRPHKAPDEHAQDDRN